MLAEEAEGAFCKSYGVTGWINSDCLIQSVTILTNSGI